MVFRASNISIHSLRVEGDFRPVPVLPVRIRFQSTPSVWRETIDGLNPVAATIFQSTPSVWRETPNCQQVHQHYQISIHSLRVEGDAESCLRKTSSSNFNPLPPCGGRLDVKIYDFCNDNFNPLPPCGGRRSPASGGTGSGCHFNPLPPCGGRLPEAYKEGAD